MREVNIKLSFDSVLAIDTRDIGYVGEHNATEIIIEIPNTCFDMADCFLIHFYDEKNSYVSNAITSETKKDGAWISNSKIHCVLWRQLTGEKYLNLSIAGYKYSGSDLVQIFKLPQVKGLRLKPACEGVIPADPKASGLYSQLERIINSLLLVSNCNNESESSESPVIVYKIGSEEIPTGRVGQLLYCIADDQGFTEEPLRFRTDPLGNEIPIKLPFRAGQIYVCSGAKWNLLCSHDWVEGDLENPNNASNVIASQPEYATMDWVLSIINAFSFGSDETLSVDESLSDVSVATGTVSFNLDGNIAHMNNNILEVLI